MQCVNKVYHQTKPRVKHTIFQSIFIWRYSFFCGVYQKTSLLFDVMERTADA